MRSAARPGPRGAGAAPAIVVVGEALVDIVHRANGAVDEVPGGSPANVALTLGRLGRRPTLVTRLGDDDRGRAVRRWLAESEVEIAAVPAARTATATAHLDRTGAATYSFDIDWDLGDDAAALGGATAAAHVVHVGSVATVLEPGAAQVASIVRGARSTAAITFDPNIRPSLIDDPTRARARVDEMIGLSDIVKASDEDLGWLHPDRDPIEAARAWARRGPALVVVTLGSRGAFGVTPDGETTVPAVPVDVIDTVGAGDTFMGALIDGLLALRPNDPGGPTRFRDLSLPDVDALLRRCALAAAITASRPGASPPRRVELDSLRTA